jgi:hypothetical protein
VYLYGRLHARTVIEHYTNIKNALVPYCSCWRPSVNCYKSFHFFALFPLAASENWESTLFVGLNNKEKHG